MKAAVKDNHNTPGLISSNKEWRALDVYYTQNGTKLSVENGVLIEEIIKKSTLPNPAMFQTCDYSERSHYRLYTSTPKPMPPPIDKVRPYASHTTEVAEAALKFYNKRHNTNYVLVDPMDCCGSLWTGGIWYHCNFKAKLETSSKTSSVSHADSSTKLFFAELKIAGPNSPREYLVTACRPIEDAKTTKVCEMCKEEVILHPTGRFRHGCHQFKRRALRPRRNGKVLGRDSK